MQPTLDKIPSWYQVPPEIKQLLLNAVLIWDDSDRSESFILEALKHPEITLDVLVSAYRYFFYRHNDPMARRLAMQVMDQIQQQESLPHDWDQLRPILVERLHDPFIRLYLSAYTALGLMLARWGAIQAALEISQRVRSVDVRNEFGAGIIMNILQDNDEEE